MSKKNAPGKQPEAVAAPDAPLKRTAQSKRPAAASSEREAPAPAKAQPAATSAPAIVIVHHTKEKP